MSQNKKSVVLTIDDEKEIRESFRNFLEDYNYTVLEAGNGRIGIQMIEDEKPDLVLVDLRMPGINGLDILKWAKENSPDTPIIVVSGTGIISDAIEALHLGACDYLIKPIEDLVVLQYAIDKSLERTRLIRENTAYQKHLESEIKRRTQELYESEKNYRLLIENQTDMIVKFDTEGRLIFVSPSYCKTFGKTQGELIGSKFPPFIPKEDRKKADKAISKTFKPPYTSRMEARTMTKEGLKWQAWINTAVLNENKEVIGIVASGRDINDRKTAEEILQHAQKLDSIGKLAGGVAHDFNNLLMPILGYTEMLLYEISSSDPRREDLKEIQKAALRSKDLIRQLLAFSRKQVLEMKSVNLGNVVNGIENMLKRTIRNNINLTINIPSSLDNIEADISQIEQVLLNLAINAQDAMPSGGDIIITASNISFDNESIKRSPELKPGPHVILEVSDTGVGMNAETLKHLFEPFFTTKKIGEGTGLGLSTVHGIIKQHNGSITVDSNPKKGTTFKIFFPKNDDITETIATNTNSYKNLTGNETIMVVEDDESVCKLICNCLEKQGYTVFEAKNGQECIKMMGKNKNNVHLLLSDVIMPGVDGQTLYKNLLNTRPGLKVIFMSGYTNKVIGKNDILDKDYPFVQKPILPHILLEKVRALLDI
ncbi:MAG: response regulator [Candidatus Theseobacter exili]|nr:response regulator [Candidatus Theseobacter exili]